jgi:hypothetical protein
VVRWVSLLLIGFGWSCVTLSPQGAGVLVFQALLDAAPARRAMPEGCVRLTTRPPMAMTELEMQGQKDPYRAERNQAGAAGANVLLVLLKQTVARHDFECPGSSPITDCPPSSGAWFRVVFESYACTPDALQALATNLSTA